jgi:glycosyltransferase involved in cell wall biosynthesis
MQTIKKIFHIPRRFVAEEWGGSETFIAETSFRLKQKGYEPHILTTLALSNQRQDSYRDIPIRRYPYFYPYIGLKKGARDVLDKKAGNLFSFALMRALRRAEGGRPDLIHLHTGKRFGAIARHYAVRKGIPYVISLHGGQLAVPQEEQETWTEPTKGALEWGKLLGWWVGSRRVLEDAAAIICVGKDEYEEMKKAFPRKDVVYLPNGVDVARFARGNPVGSDLEGSRTDIDGSRTDLDRSQADIDASRTDLEGRRQVSDSRTRFRKAYAIPEDRFVYLVTARFDVQKNQLGLVQQLGNIISRIPDAHLLLVGAVTSPRYLDAVRQAAADARIADRITIIPGIPYTDRSLVDAYHAADSFILPSLHEPFGMVVLEAWAAGLSAAVSRRGGLPSIVTHNETGLLFDPEAPYDHSDSIASALIELRSDAEKRKRLAGAGRKTAAETYSWDAVTDQLIEIYRRAYAHTLS